MKLEEEIKQSKFKDPYHKAMLNIIFTANWLELRATQIFKQFGLSSQQFNVLRILRGSSPRPLNLSDIQERMMDRMSNATRLVEKLRQKGLLTRHECPSNRRKVEIAITQKGLDMLAAIDPIQDKYHKELSKKITKEDAILISDMLDKWRD